jgi:hypothetical protein
MDDVVVILRQQYSELLGDLKTVEVHADRESVSKTKKYQAKRISTGDAPLILAFAWSRMRIGPQFAVQSLASLCATSQHLVSSLRLHDPIQP